DKSFFHGFYDRYELHSACCSEQMSDHGLGRVDNHIFCRISERGFDGDCLKQIVVVCTCSVCVDISYILRFYACLFHSICHGTCRTASVFNRGSDVVSIACRTVSYHFCVNLCPPCFGVLQLFQNNNAGSPTENESASVLV